MYAAQLHTSALRALKAVLDGAWESSSWEYSHWVSTALAIFSPRILLLSFPTSIGPSAFPLWGQAWYRLHCVEVFTQGQREQIIDAFLKTTKITDLSISLGLTGWNGITTSWTQHRVLMHILGVIQSTRHVDSRRKSPCALTSLYPRDRGVSPKFSVWPIYLHRICSGHAYLLSKYSGL